MNRSPSGSLVLDKAIQGFVNYKMAEGLSDRSVDSYERILKKWADHTGEKKIGSITSQDIVAYLKLAAHGIRSPTHHRCGYGSSNSSSITPWLNFCTINSTVILVPLAGTFLTQKII